MQTHYHLDVIEKNLIENFTHEHLSGFYAKPLNDFFSNNSMKLLDVIRVPAKEGSIRCFIQKNTGPYEIKQSVKEVVDYETSIGMNDINRHDSVINFIKDIKEPLLKLIRECSNDDIIAGYGTSTGATTFMYNYDIGSKINYLIDDDQYRQGLYSPGNKIQVCSREEINKNFPKYIIILAPLYADNINVSYLMINLYNLLLEGIQSKFSQKPLV